MNRALVVAGMLASGTALAGASQSNPMNREYSIQHAAAIHITPRGQEGISARLPKLLESQGINLEHQKHDSLKLPATEISLRKLPSQLGSYGPLLRDLQKNITDWLSSFTLKNPKIIIEALAAGYDAEGLQVSVRPDLYKTQQYFGSESGIALTVELTVPTLRLYASQVRTRDLNNDFLNRYVPPVPFPSSINKKNARAMGELAKRFSDTLVLNNPFMDLRDPRPLRAAITVRVQINSNGQILFDTLEASTNLDQLNWIYPPMQMIFPRVELRVNDQRSFLDPKPLQDKINQNEAALVRVLQHYLKGFIEKEFPTFLNSIVYPKLASAFNTVRSIEPSEGDVFHTGSQLQLGFRPSHLSLNERFLSLDLNGFVADPDVTWDEKVAPTARPRPAALEALSPESYDLAVSFSEDVLNRITALGFQRGAWQHIETGDAHYGRLARAPVFSALRNGHGNLNIIIELNTLGFEQRIGLTNPYQVELNLDLIIRASPQGNVFNILLDHYDENTARIDDRFLTSSLLREKVSTALRDTLREMNQKNVPRRIIAEGLGVLDDLFGLKMRIKSAEYDRCGFINLYMEYEGPAR